MYLLLDVSFVAHQVFPPVFPPKLFSAVQFSNLISLENQRRIVAGTKGMSSHGSYTKGNLHVNPGVLPPIVTQLVSSNIYSEIINLAIYAISAQHLNLNRNLVIKLVKYVNL